MSKKERPTGYIQYEFPGFFGKTSVYTMLDRMDELRRLGLMDKIDTQNPLSLQFSEEAIVSQNKELPRFKNEPDDTEAAQSKKNGYNGNEFSDRLRADVEEDIIERRENHFRIR